MPTLPDNDQAVQSQLPLHNDDGYNFGSYYVSEDNRDCVDLLSSDALMQQPQWLLWGKAGVGKSHLLQASCQRMTEQSQHASYLNCAYAAQLLQPMASEKHLPNFIALDDVDALAGDAELELQLFNLINSSREQSTVLMLAARHNPRFVDWQLADLASRLQWGASFCIAPLSDEGMKAMLTLRAKLRGLLINEAVARYCLRHFNHDSHSLMRLLDEMDAGASQAQRKITIPFIKQLFNERP